MVARKSKTASKIKEEQGAYGSNGSTRHPLRIVDLFCGAGGLSLGLTKAGCEIIYAADFFGAAIDTHNRNLGGHGQRVALDWETKLPVCDVIVGGPPCQGFSTAGLRKPGDSRNTLVAVFAHLVATHKPKAFIFENVEGFLTGEGGRWVCDLLDPLIRAGYCIHLRKINAANYGVPQHRKRVLAIGGLGWDPGFPEMTHSAYGAPGAIAIAGLKNTPNLLEALAGLGSATTKPPETNTDHFYTPPNESDLARMRAIGPGQTMRDIPEELWHRTFRKRAFRRVKDGMPSEKRGGAPSGMRRLDERFPSKAITSGATSEFIHPHANRNLTLRECARIQTFPDGFLFSGTKAERAVLIGNAVPPTLGAVLGNHLMKAFQHRAETHTSAGLLSFQPTRADAMSPALKKVTSTVEKRYGMREQQEFFDSLSEAPPEPYITMNSLELSQAQKTLIEKARNVGASEMAIPLTEPACAYLCALIVHDLNAHKHFPEVPAVLPPFFETWPVSDLALSKVSFEPLAAKLFNTVRDSDTYFTCLAALHKSRLKFEQILKRQAIPTFDQVGPRSLIQYGSMSAKSLAGMLYWRKWLYDIDGRAGQETGYLFEPIIAHAIGGTPISHTRSPIKRLTSKGGRQVDCIKGKKAYEFKVRVTIAASGQGRWGEELAFPKECKASGYKPILVVLDPTKNPKLTELQKAFKQAGGKSFVGLEAWKHIENEAGATMASFLEKYIRHPLNALSAAADKDLPDFTVKMAGDHLEFTIGAEKLRIKRQGPPLISEKPDMPEDVSD